ncbi:hypothetical protein ACLKA6_010650 [Drosophila palustris]
MFVYERIYAQSVATRTAQDAQDNQAEHPKYAANSANGLENVFMNFHNASLSGLSDGPSACEISSIELESVRSPTFSKMCGTSHPVHKYTPCISGIDLKMVQGMDQGMTVPNALALERCLPKFQLMMTTLYAPPLAAGC